MKRKITLPIILIFVIVLAMLSPSAVHGIQNILLKSTVKTTVSSETKQIQLKKDDYIYLGKYLDEDILWKVLEIKDNKVLLMSEYVICFKAFDAKGESNEFHGSDSEKYGSSVWKNSSLKQWLNSDESVVLYTHCPPEKGNTFNSYNIYDGEHGFLNKQNFSEEEKNLITDDGVFLLSKAQLKKYFSNFSRKKICTNSCIKQNDAPYINLPGKSVWYWSSSAATSNNVSVTAVTSNGTFYKSLAFDGTMGVCPALYINNQTYETCEGNGNKNAPYMLEVKK